MTSTTTTIKRKVTAKTASRRRRGVGSQRERVLVEFPLRLLERADEAATELATSRSELIRSAVEQMIEKMEKARFEAELADAYAANAQRNTGLLEEFIHIDREGF
jgi:metal-responsive CopG/Arc/MetJ family transcriptional regulator